MDKTKEKQLIPERFLFLLFLVIFPLGQLSRLEINLFNYVFTVQLIDIVVLLAIPLLLLGRFQIPKIFNDIKIYFIILIFSIISSLSFFKFVEILPGIFYLLRLFAYSSFLLMVYSLIREKILTRRQVYMLGIGMLFVTAILGIIQYIFFPDVRILKNIGWDDHLYRLVGTQLDPGFMGILMVFGFIGSLSVYMKKKKIEYLIAACLFTICAVLTYSRATYLSLIVGIFYLFYAVSFKSIKKYIIYFVLAFAVTIPFLPRIAGEGVKLERTYSIFARIENYQQTWSIFAKNPLFGVGYNNLCVTTTKIFTTLPESHSCGGSDSSFLLLLATTGITGIIMLIYVLNKIRLSLNSNYYANSLLASSLALLFHSQFINSLFYPWVLGYMMLLMAISVKESS